MEKKNLIGLLFILLIIFLYPFYLQIFAPQPSPKITKTAVIDFPQEVSIQVVDKEEVKNYDTVHDTVLQNKHLRIECTNKGAGINMIQLIQFNNQQEGNPISIYKNDTYSKKILYFTHPFLNYDLNKAVYAYNESKNGVSYYLLVPGQCLIEKKIILEENTHLLKFNLRLQNLDQKPLPVNVGFVGGQNLKTKEPWEERYWEIAFAQEGKIKHEFFRQIRTSKIYLAPLPWLALKSKYFSQIIVPSSGTTSFTAQRLADNGLEVSVQVPLTILQPGETKEENFLFYFGPLDTRVLHQYNSEWKEIVYYGMFDGIAKFILRILRGGFMLLKNYGLAIIFLSLLVNLFLFPFTWKSMKSMQALQSLQPQIERLRKEYAQDPQRLNKEILGIYQKHKVNPFGGCLPLFLQMPIFVSLYQVLSRAVELKGARFLWIKDLSLPDNLFSFPQKVLFLDSFNLLPLIMVLLMYLQQKKTQVYSPSQKQTTWFMPFFFGFIFYNFPSGLVLYWLVSTLLNLILQGKVHKG
ncbi:MAG: membrane protein insertase YidC [Candidatus Omnitrophica bacterium]|nr:membrane protein insertase YidC [Candidatus Omnitrophota bacterium]